MMVFLKNPNGFEKIQGQYHGFSGTKYKNHHKNTSHGLLKVTLLIIMTIATLIMVYFLIGKEPIDTKFNEILYPAHKKYGLEKIQWVTERVPEEHQEFLKKSKNELVIIQRHVGAWNTNQIIYEILKEQANKGVNVKFLVLDPNSEQGQRLTLEDQQRLKANIKKLIKLKKENPTLSVEVRLIKELLPFAMDMVDCNILADKSIKVEKHSRINIHPKTAIDPLDSQSIHTMLIYTFKDAGEKSPYQIYRNMIGQIWNEHSTELEKSSSYKMLTEELIF